jgi:hypothetical protein
MKKLLDKTKLSNIIIITLRLIIDSATTVFLSDSVTIIDKMKGTNAFIKLLSLVRIRVLDEKVAIVMLVQSTKLHLCPHKSQNASTINLRTLLFYACLLILYYNVM